MPAKPKKKTSARVGSDVRPAKSAKAPPPAYFLSLSVENVRCFGPKQALDLSDGSGHPARWTVILGENGTGKTTLLQSIVALEPSDTAMSDVDEVVLTPKGGWAHRARDWQLYRHGNEIPAYIIGLVSYGGNLTDKSTRWRKEVISYGIGWRTDAESLSGHDPEILGGLVVYAYGAGRRMGTGALSEEVLDDPTESLFSEDVPLRNAEEWLLQTDYTASKRSPIQKQAKRRAERVKNILVNVLPDVTNLRVRSPKRVQDKPRVEFRTPYGWVPIRSLGFGYRAMVAWTVDLASRLFERYPDSKDPIAEPAVVLVDEIDLHMHPQWQRKIMSFLCQRFQNTQFIVTAHSPLIVQAATDANIAVLRREGDHVVIDQSIKAVRGWRIDQVLTSDLFGLKSARGQEFDALMEEREKILSKKRLTKKDKSRLDEITEELTGTPVGETASDVEAMNILRRAAMAYNTDPSDP